MDRYKRQDAGMTADMERHLRALIAEYSAPPVTGMRTTTSWPVLNWGAIVPGREGALPEAMVTWPGHGRENAAQNQSARSIAPTPGTPVDCGPGDASPGTPVGGDEPSGVSQLVADGGLVGGDAALVGLDKLPVGAALVDVLAGIEVADLADDVLLDVGARWQDLISWATAMQSRALGEIARRRSWTEEHNAAAAEISARLRVPQREANKHLARGAGLAEHPQVMNALHAGLIDTAKADILLRSGNPLTHEERDEAITRYLPQAPDHTREWLRNKMNEFAHRLKGALETTKHAMARRAVYLDPADNTMAWISANLPAPDAAAVWDAIEQAAHTLRRTPGTTRTLAQARADALVAITTGRIIVPPHPECTPTRTTTRATAETATAETRATTGTTTTDAATTTAPGMAGAPATVTAAAATAGAVIEAAPADTTTGTAQPGSELEPAGPSPATRATKASTAQDPDEKALPRTTVPAAGCTCGGCTCGGTEIRVVQVKPQIRVTIPATALLGLDNAPGHLQGYGPIPADIAAQIATDATWHRLITDPTTGILTDYSTTTYHPGKILRRAVTARDQTCAFPHCERPAHWADLDHIDPFDHDLESAHTPPGTPGQTRATNLQPLCRAHHLAKTHHGWTPVRDPATGTTTWTAPTGHTYTRPPTQTGQVSNDITSLTDDTRVRLGQPPPNQRPTTERPTTAGSTITERPITERPTIAETTSHGSTTDGSNTAEPIITASITERSSVEPPTTEQRLRRFPDEPPF